MEVSLRGQQTQVKEIVPVADNAHGDLDRGAVGDNVHPRVDMDGFEIQRPQWKHNKRHILCNRTHEKVKGHDRVRHLFVSRVHCSTKDEDVEEMV